MVLYENADGVFRGVAYVSYDVLSYCGYGADLWETGTLFRLCKLGKVRRPGCGRGEMNSLENKYIRTETVIINFHGYSFEITGESIIRY